MAKKDTRPYSVRIAELEKAREQVELVIRENFSTASVGFMREQEHALAVLDDSLTYLRTKAGILNAG